MSTKSLRFIALLFVALLLVFSLHLLIRYISAYPLWEHQIVLSYGINFLLAVVVLFMVERSLDAKSSHSGFIFMAGSALKFLVFFLVFYPIYNADDKMETAEFSTFFIPYALCLTLEVYYLSKALNNQES